MLAGRAGGPLVFLAVVLPYLGVAQYVVWLNDPVHAGASLWPGAGLSLAALLMLPTRLWPWVLAAVATAELSNDLFHRYPLTSSVGWALANCVEPALGALLLRRFGNRAALVSPLRRLLVFLALCVVVAPAVGGVIGATASVIGFGGSLPTTWLKFFLGDALGVLIVAPALLTAHRRWTRRSSKEAIALVACTLFLTAAVFGPRGGPWTTTLAYLIIPFFTWAALRFGIRGTSWLALVVTMVANWFTAVGGGPFVAAVSPSGHSVSMLQGFLAITVSSALILAATVSQLSGREEVEAELRHQASHDVLTGLPNRAHLAAALESALATGAAEPSRLALLVCDIDHLKSVNDANGHLAGDALIIAIARRIERTVRPGDLVARISGDEFVVMLTDVDARTAAGLCERILAAVSEPLMLSPSKEMVPSVSIGVALGEPGASGESIFNGADAALYEAKKLGRGRTAYYDDQLRTRAREQLSIEDALPEAFSGTQIYVLHQPEVVLATGKLFAFESLARWRHPQRGLILPDQFVPAMEATGTAGRLFETVLEQTLAAQERWATNLGFRPSIAVNLSARQLADAELPATIALALARAGAPADQLCLELTETAIAGESALASLNSLKELGVRLALDDFGTGWSSLSRLAQYPWDLLKIDRSFIAPLGTDERAEHLVRATIVMAHALGIPTVAEGVETHEQLDRLVDLGCDIAQGYLFSPAVSAREAVDLVDGTGRWTGCGPTAWDSASHRFTRPATLEAIG